MRKRCTYLTKNVKNGAFILACRSVYLCNCASATLPLGSPYGGNYETASNVHRSARQTGKLYYESTVIFLYTSSHFLFTDYPLYFFCLQFTAQTVIFDNVARDRYLTKDFNNGLGSEVRPNWRSRNTESSCKLYLTFQQYIMHSCGITLVRFCCPS